MNYGFVIDNSSCIGCHACSTACKSEHQVPLGVNRTWVKVVESGRYPDVRRSFQVTRCNHCENAPCVRICPTSAMHQRPDGIVDFDSDACIGCKACLQACPYDAIHLDPDTHTAAKCNYCAHRVDVGVEPACVVVCPEHAIIAGDLDDPTSEIRGVMAKHNLSVRKPEQGTAPNLFYIEGNAQALHPTEAPSQMMFTDVLDLQPGQPVALHQAQGIPEQGPLGSSAPRVAYNAQHQLPWHWPIPAYLITKHIAGGSFMWLGVLTLLGTLPSGVFVPVGLLGILCTLATLALLIYDLDRPDRFFFLLVRPQWGSWVARAAWLLSGFSAVSIGWWVAALFVDLGGLLPVVALASVLLGFGTAVYTAFLFAQAEGRDLWQGTHVPFQMTLHAAALGAAPLAVMGVEHMTTVFLVGMGCSLLLTLFADLGVPQASELARRGAREMVWGRYLREYWLGGIVVGHILPLSLASLGSSFGMALALLAAGVGLFLYNLAFVMAPQHLPNS